MCIYKKIQNQDKFLVNLQQSISFINGSMSKIWTSLEAEREALSNDNSKINAEEENVIITLSYLMEKVILFLGQTFNTCGYIRRLIF